MAAKGTTESFTFDTNCDGWEVENATFTHDTSIKHGGAGSCKLCVTTKTAGSIWLPRGTQGPGTYRFDVWLRVEPPNETNGVPFLTAFTATGTYVKKRAEREAGVLVLDDTWHGDSIELDVSHGVFLNEPAARFEYRVDAVSYGALPACVWIDDIVLTFTPP